MNEGIQEWQLITQALLDAEGYPKSEENRKQLGYSTGEIRELLDKLMKDHNKILSDKEKQMILNCIDGAFDYVNTDIHTLYDIPASELKHFKVELEKRWGMRSTYGKDQE